MDPIWQKKLNGYFIGFCRKTFRWSPVYREVVKAAEVPQPTGKPKYRCCKCSRLVERLQKQVDHIDPVIPPGQKFDGDWNWYRDRMFVEKSNLQVMCRACHKDKSVSENKRRRECKKKSKKKRSV